MFFDAKSKWCADFFSKVREAHREMIRTHWFLWKVIGFMEGESQRFQLPDGQVEAFERKVEEMLVSFMRLFRHLRFTPGSRLELAGDGCRIGGRAWLVLRLPDGRVKNVCDVWVNPWSVEEIWEKETLCWISGQFYLHRHVGIEHETILLGDVSTFGDEMNRWTDESQTTIEEFKAALSLKDLARFENAVFAPRVRWLGLFPYVVYHAFAPFGGIYRRVAGWPRCLCGICRCKPIVAYRSGIIY